MRKDSQQPTRYKSPGANCLRAVVEVVPVVACAQPVVAGGGVAGLVVCTAEALYPWRAWACWPAALAHRAAAV